MLAPRSAQAQAAEPARAVVTRAQDGRGTQAERIAEALVLRLRARGIAARRPPAPAEPPRLRGQLEAAERAYANLHPERARQQLEALLERLDATGGGGLDRSELLRALLLLALSAQVEGDGAAADAALARALAVDPKLSPDPARYPPPLRARLERVRADQPLSRRVRLSFEGLPPGVRVWVDAMELGPDERSLRVAPGPHLLRVGGGGWRPEGRRVEVDAEQRRRFRFELAVDPGAALRDAGAPGDPATASIRRGAAALDAAPLLLDVTIDDDDGSRIVARDLAAGRTVRVAAGAGADPGEVATRLAERLAGPSPLRAPSAERTRRRWIGVGAGVVAAAILTGVIVALAQDDSADQWRAVGRRP